MSQYKDIPLDDLDGISRGILSFITFLDESAGADTWTSNQVAFVSGVLFIVLFYSAHAKRGIEWFALVHALITGIGSAACVYLDMYASKTLTGVQEPLRSASCMSSHLTSLHMIIPSITLGYSICDILNGFRLGGAFLAHGFATFSVMLIFLHHDCPQPVNSMLIMELSTIILTMLKADFFSPVMQYITQSSFAIMFFLCRIVMAPYVWFDIMKHMYKAVYVDKTNTCYPPYIFYLAFSFGMFFHCLNSFWFVKIVKKIKRKLNGTETIGNLKKD